MIMRLQFWDRHARKWRFYNDYAFRSVRSAQEVVNDAPYYAETWRLLRVTYNVVRKLKPMKRMTNE